MGRTLKRGAGNLLNRVIDKLPFEAHLPGLNFCGPGTKLEKRLARGDKGVNQLDEACKLHDISYAQSSDYKDRRRADKELAERAWRRFKDPSSSLSEKAASWIVTTAMKAKSKIGGSIKKRKGGSGGGKGTRGKGLYLKPYPMKSGYGIKRRGGVRKKGTVGRKRGGVLPLLPVFAGLSALGSLVGGAASVAKAYHDIKTPSKPNKTGGRLKRSRSLGKKKAR